MPSTSWNLRWGLCVVGKCTPEDDAHQVKAVYVYVHHSHTDRTYSHHWRQQSTILLSSWLFHNTRVAMLGVSSSLARGTCDLSPTASRRFPMVLGDTAGATCARISSLDAVWMATAACTMRRSWHSSVQRSHSEPGLWMWECSTGHCWKQWHTTNTLCPKCQAISWYVHSAFCRPTLWPRSNDCSQQEHLS